ncbi:MAG: esterase-like activity of phytase family protein [Alphaproteobacteria bacterium]|nr:esterase-like activity of phytase family protein [Alphaproteobacteria bacterium]
MKSASLTRLCLLGALALTLAACNTFMRDTGEQTITPVDLDPRNPGEVRIGNVVFLAGYKLDFDARFFGGLSGLLIAGDGGSMLAVTDHGDWVEAPLNHDSTGRLTGVGTVTMSPLIGVDGEAIDTILEPQERDAEGLARMPDGRVMVSFERRHRVWVYDDLAQEHEPLELDLPETITRLPGNDGIETITFLPDGRLLMIAEEPASTGTTIDAWILEDGLTWRWVGYIMRDGFSVTDATALPDGRIIVLERWFAAPMSLRIRLRELTPAMLDSGAPLDGVPTVLFKQNLIIDNFEGLDHRIGPKGEIFLYMISDDNFALLQATYLYQFRLDP